LPPFHIGISDYVDGPARRALSEFLFQQSTQILPGDGVGPDVKLGTVTVPYYSDERRLNTRTSRRCDTGSNQMDR
jgi:hypothetical protein